MFPQVIKKCNWIQHVWDRKGVCLCSNANLITDNSLYLVSESTRDLVTKGVIKHTHTLWGCVCAILVCECCKNSRGGKPKLEGVYAVSQGLYKFLMVKMLKLGVHSQALRGDTPIGKVWKNPWRRCIDITILYEILNNILNF